MKNSPRYEIYGFGKGDRSGRIRWLLEEVGVPYEDRLLQWKNGDHEKPEYLKLNPMGMSPTLVEDGKPMIESVAICLYLADKYAAKMPLAPAIDSPLRAQYLQAMLFIGASFDSRVNEYFTIQFNDSLSAEQKAEKMKPIQEDLRYMIRTIDAQLAGKQYLVGNEFSAADILTTGVLAWVSDIYKDEEFPSAAAYLKRNKARPAAQKSGAFFEG